MPSIEASYVKKIGLPGYSSHSFSVTVRTEIDDVSQVEKQSNQLYALLQKTVDRNLEQEVGYIPQLPENGHSPEPNHQNGSGNYHYTNRSNSNDEYWKCSDKQRDLILKIIDEHRLDKQEIENLSKDMFQKPVKSLNKMEASGLIEELIEKYGPARSNGNDSRNGGRQYQRGRR